MKPSATKYQGARTVRSLVAKGESLALKIIGASSEKKEPFFAVVWFGSPHIPHKPLPAELAVAGGSAYYGELLEVARSIGTLRAGLRKLPEHKVHFSPAGYNIRADLVRPYLEKFKGIPVAPGLRTSR